VFVDAYFVIRLLTTGGIVLFDDSSNPHILKVLQFLRTSITGLEELRLSHYKHHRLIHGVARRLGKVNLTAFRRIGDVERAWDSEFRPLNGNRGTVVTRELTPPDRGRVTLPKSSNNPHCRQANRNIAFASAPVSMRMGCC